MQKNQSPDVHYDHCFHTALYDLIVERVCVKMETMATLYWYFDAQSTMVPHSLLLLVMHKFLRGLSVFQDYEALPQSNNSADIDLIISPKSVLIWRQCIEKIARNNNLVVDRASQYYYCRQFAVFGLDDGPIRFDLIPFFRLSSFAKSIA